MNQQLFLEMIDAAINGKTIDLSEVDEEFIRVAKEQTFLPFLYVASKDKKYKKYYIQSVLIHERINEVGKLIDDILNEAKIPHIFLKGYELQNLYPDPNLRMMGDIDLIVKPEDFDKAKIALINKGVIQGKDDEHHLQLTKNEIEIELHHNLFERNEEWMLYFNKPFDNTYKINDYNLSFKLNYYYMYILAHYAKHIQNCGEGIRPIIDLYLLYKISLKKNIPIKIENNLINFDKMIKSAFFSIFKEKTCEITNKYYNLFINSLFERGVHGLNVDSTLVVYQNNNNIGLVKKLFNNKRFKLNYIKTKYKSSKFIITIPFIYILEFFKLLLIYFNNLKKSKVNKKEYRKMYKSLGIEDNYF